MVIYIGKQAAEALKAIRPAEEQLDLQAPVFNLSPQQIGRRVTAAAKAAGLGEGFTGHSGRVGMAQDLASNRHGAAVTHDRGKVEELQDAGQVYRTAGRRPRRGSKILPGTRRLATFGQEATAPLDTRSLVRPCRRGNPTRPKKRRSAG